MNFKKENSTQLQKIAKYFTALLSIFLVVGFYTTASAQNNTVSDTTALAKVNKDIIYYPMQNCYCCSSYAEYLNDHDFHIDKKKASSTKELKKIAKQDNVPRKYRKQKMTMQTGMCHITEIGDYTVVGHVPANVIQRLIKQHPENIAGIILPGMPLGSPGMNKVNEKNSNSLVIYAFNENGKTWVYAKVHTDPPYAPIQ